MILGSGGSEHMNNTLLTALADGVAGPELEFLVADARQYGEPGVLVSFEESAAEVTRNARSLGFDLDHGQPGLNE